MHDGAGLGATYLATGLTVVALYFACLAYGRYKLGHSNLLTRFV